MTRTLSRDRGGRPREARSWEGARGGEEGERVGVEGGGGGENQEGDYDAARGDASATEISGRRRPDNIGSQPANNR